MSGIFGLRERYVVSMDISYSIEELDYNKRSGNLTVEASGVVKSEKHFPFYDNEDGKRYIFKPLSKTKPFTTPLFAYAEVFWSNIINHYFMDAPVYQLAVCHGYNAEQPKYYEYGTVVPSVCNAGEHLVNLLEFYRERHDSHVDIDNYVNYCMMFYDYTDIFKSDFVRSHKVIGEELAMQVLLSILKGDQNYHYENVAFICDENNNVKRLAPMIDHEFSTMFLFPDNFNMHLSFVTDLLGSMRGIKNQNEDCKNEEEKKLLILSSQNLNRNIRYIASHYPNVAVDFLNKMYRFGNDLENMHLYDNGYLFPCNSWSYRVGIERYKNNDEQAAEKYEKVLQYTDIDLHNTGVCIKRELKVVMDVLHQEINRN